ncbi:hypothetical protein D7294_03630 [Streptomyces hoynatensis]|uniref:Uncharacterized protein n=1 Tax=Streptomyces hoynatensis TaxID=1141874 RepID=A0A3A9ZB85_9ACTN|nr:hypothetical protein D7294_03630 [Streptomyces hoynatensis]
MRPDESVLPGEGVTRRREPAPGGGPPPRPGPGPGGADTAAGAGAHYPARGISRRAPEKPWRSRRS